MHTITNYLNSSRTLLRFVLLLLFSTMAGCTASRESQIDVDATAEWQAEVATRGVEVMPFDLERTTHIFEKQPDGGLQQVIADDASDDDQIPLIRMHLSEEAERFRQGDFHDPAMIHGDDMAGLHELMLGSHQITITYSELPNGAQIHYTTDDPEMISAIHSWFDAQLADHAGHASEHSED